MAPARVVPTLDPGKDRQARLGPGLSGPAGDEFTFQARKKTLRHGVVVGISHAAHRWAHPHLLAALAKGDAGVLLGFKELSQHQSDKPQIVVRKAPRPVFSSLASCVACH